MKRYVLQILVYLLTGMIIVAGLDWISALSHTYRAMMMEEMYRGFENIDTLFMGSSHAYRSYDTKIADELLEADTFNAGSSSQLLITTYYLLNEIGNKHEITTIYLDTFFGVFIAEASPDELSMYRISDHMEDLDNKLEYLWAAGGIRGIENGIIYRYSRNLKNADIKGRLRSERLLPGEYDKLEAGVEEYRGKGFVYSYNRLKPETIDFRKEAEKYDLTGDIPISDDSYEYLMKIIGYCAQNGITLVLVDQPMPDELLSRINGYDHYVAFLSSIAEENGIDYLNFNLLKDYEKNLDDFTDANHLNGPGAQKYTRIFCNTINALKNKEKTQDDLFYHEYVPDRTLERM